MEWKRRRHFSEEEEDRGRRSSQRFRKKVRYVENNEEEEEDEDEEEEDEEDQEENEQPGPSTQHTHNQRTQENRLLPVTCGNKNGILDVDKLGKGDACIECEGRWFAPPAFEDLGGKGHSKKWKASIFHENKPLQFWFEQGSLTTEGFKRRRTKATKHKRILSSHHESDSSSAESEIGLQSAEETEEDDVEDEDWHPDSEELAPEKEEEEERIGAENRGEVVEEEDKMEKGEMEDEDIPAVADNDSDNSVFEGSEKIDIISASKKSALRMKLQVVIERLPEFQVRCDRQSDCGEHPIVGSRFTPLDEKAQSEEERGDNASAKDDTFVTSAAHIDPTQMSYPPIVGRIKEENGEELSESVTQSNDSEGQREIKTEASNSPSTATSSPDIKPDILNKTEDDRSTSNPTADLTDSSFVTVADTAVVADIIEDGELETGHLQAFANENVANRERGFKEEGIEAMGVGPPTIPMGVLVGYRGVNCGHTFVATSGHNAAQLQEMEQDKRCLQTVQASDMVECPSSGPSAGFNLDTMDLDQLKREKIKMQLKVLKLQEEYYKLQIQKCKQENE